MTATNDKSSPLANVGTNMIMQIPDDPRFIVKEGLVYIDECIPARIVGMITPFTPPGFMELFMSVVTMGGSPDDKRG